jgi:CheY-like chemotaxis protein
MNDETSPDVQSSADKSPNSAFIFLAEDDVDDQEILVDCFRNLSPGITVRVETNGRKAIKTLDSLAGSHLPCLIVLDYNLPEVDGSEILKHLKNDSRFDNIPKVVWSTSNSELFSTRSLALGARAYFVKPVDMNGVTNLAKEMLGFCNITV